MLVCIARAGRYLLRVFIAQTGPVVAGLAEGPCTEVHTYIKFGCISVVCLVGVIEVLRILRTVALMAVRTCQHARLVVPTSYPLVVYGRRPRHTLRHRATVAT